MHDTGLAAQGLACNLGQPVLVSFSNVMRITTAHQVFSSPGNNRNSVHTFPSTFTVSSDNPARASSLLSDQ